MPLCKISIAAYFLMLVPLCLVKPVLAAQQLPIEDAVMPEPLTLKYALSQASRTNSTEIMNYSAQRQRALADQDFATSKQGIFAYINGRLRYVKPSSNVPQDATNDNKISLDISKRLYDFGQTSSRIEASVEKLASVEALYGDYISKRTIDILQAYFNVLLADIIYNHSNELMAVHYVRLDKIRSRAELGQISDIELLKVENDYRKVLRDRNQASSDQRTTRFRLAQLINPGNLSSELNMPDMQKLKQLSVKRKLGEIEEIYQLAYQKNPRILSLNHQLKSAQLNRQAFQSEKYPVISAHLQAADYKREFGTSDKYRAGIEISIPLYQAGQENANIRRATALVMEMEAEKLQITQELEQHILELWLKITDLKQQFSDPDFTLEYRDLYLDRSRALYELEVTSDLGDAMVELTQAQLFKAQVFFELAISWAKLDSLTGNSMNYYE
ncbi:MAG: TolC family protein [Pseudomonadota bacterium]